MVHHNSLLATTSNEGVKEHTFLPLSLGAISRLDTYIVLGTATMVQLVLQSQIDTKQQHQKEVVKQFLLYSYL